jgi:hypothetical protein
MCLVSTFITPVITSITARPIGHRTILTICVLSQPSLLLLSLVSQANRTSCDTSDNRSNEGWDKTHSVSIVRSPIGRAVILVITGVMSSSYWTPYNTNTMCLVSTFITPVITSITARPIGLRPILTICVLCIGLSPIGRAVILVITGVMKVETRHILLVLDGVQ